MVNKGNECHQQLIDFTCFNVPLLTPILEESINHLSIRLSSNAFSSPYSSVCLSKYSLLIFKISIFINLLTLILRCSDARIVLCQKCLNCMVSLKQQWAIPSRAQHGEGVEWVLMTHLLKIVFFKSRGPQEFCRFL